MSYQNHDGGWATYENTRSFHALEVRRWAWAAVAHVPISNNANCAVVGLQQHSKPFLRTTTCNQERLLLRNNVCALTGFEPSRDIR